MKVKLGDKVCTEFGIGKIVAMTEEWCIVCTHPEQKVGYREVAVSWEGVSIPAEPGVPSCTLGEKEL